MLASIDIGTNSTRLLVAECDGARTKTMVREMVITRLGEGVDDTGVLSEGAIRRTSEVLRQYGRTLDEWEPEEVRAAATSALRDCRNGGKFLDAASGLLGVRPEILTGEEEARMSYLGAISDLGPDDCGGVGPILVFDIGGGSTELVVSPGQGEPGPGAVLDDLRVWSIDVGCVRMSERFLLSDPPSPVAVGRMESFIVGRLMPVFEGYRDFSCGVGLAGTVTTLSGIEQGLTEYDTNRIHHAVLSRSDVDRLFVELASIDVESRKRIMGLEPDRADVIVGGIAVLRAIMGLAGIERLLVSEKDILDGIVIGMYRRGSRGYSPP